MTDRIRILTVDDHDLMRAGIRLLLMAFDDFQLVAEARNGREAIALYAEAKPDVIVMDMKMPELDGIAVTRAIKESHSEARILILSSFHSVNLVRRALEAGASGYLLKDATKEELAHAIRAAYSGQVTLAPDAADDLSRSETASEQTGVLSPREREILRHVAEGMSNKEIARHLGRSPFTVRHHVSSIISKLGVSNRAEAAAVAVQLGLVPVPGPDDVDP